MSELDRRLVREGAPTETNLLEEVTVIAALMDVPAKMYVSSTWWARFVAEMRAQCSANLRVPADAADWAALDSVRMGQLTVINAGTDDQRIINLRNQFDPGAKDFRGKVERLRLSRERLRNWL